MYINTIKDSNVSVAGNLLAVPSKRVSAGFLRDSTGDVDQYQLSRPFLPTPRLRLRAANHFDIPQGV